MRAITRFYRSSSNSSPLKTRLYRLDLINFLRPSNFTARWVVAGKTKHQEARAGRNPNLFAIWRIATLFTSVGRFVTRASRAAILLLLPCFPGFPEQMLVKSVRGEIGPC